MKKLLTFDEFINESATDRFLQSAASNLVKQMKNKAISKDTLMNKLNSMPLAAKLKSDELDIIVNYAMSIVDESEKIHESKGYEGDVDTAEDIIDLIYELPNSIQSLRLPFDIKGKSMLDLTPSKDKDWKEKAAAVIKDIVGKEGNRLKFKLKSHFGRGGDNEPYYLIIIK